MAQKTIEDEIVIADLWHKCLNLLQHELSPQQFVTLIKPLQAIVTEEQLSLLAPNRFVLESVKQQFLEKINAIVDEIYPQNKIIVTLQVGSQAGFLTNTTHEASSLPSQTAQSAGFGSNSPHRSNLNNYYTFSNFVVGKSNQLANAAALQVAQNPGGAYNPLFLYGAVGLGKTHLMVGVGHAILQHRSQAKVLYLHSERFVAEMIKALQTNTITEFKKYYRSLDALLIDDIQFFAGKDRSQEELFHIFNALLEQGRQMIFTCDRYPKEIDGLEERLKSRFGWGLTVAIEPPELETRVAILLNKAEQSQVSLSPEVAFFIAKRIRSNVRELEGALKRVAANAHFTGQEITLEFARETLKDLIALQDKLVTIENILKTVAEYYKTKVSDLLSKRRSRSIARPRQIAMALAKELTNHSFPEIGNAFGGRDHTTVIHACRLIEELKQTQPGVKEDWQNLIRILSA